MAIFGARATTTEFRRIFEASPALLLVLDPEFRIVAATDSYLAASMTKREEIVGRDIFEVFPDNPSDPDATGTANLRVSLERVRSDRATDTMAVQKYDLQRMDGDGGFEQRFWSPSNSPVFNEGGDLLFIVHRVEDVTEFVRLKEAASVGDVKPPEEAVDRMEAEILQRSSELQSANSALRVAGDAKNEFLSRMSHELRTPLTAINGFSELLSLADLDQEQQKWVSSIRKAGRHLLELVNEVLDLSRIESGKLSVSPEPVALDYVLDEAIELMIPQANTQNIEMERVASDRGSYVVADGQRLKQVFINLISNAIKYNRPGGSVRVYVDRLSADRVRICIEDTGKGIPAESLPKLFVPFERLDAAASSVEGTGLGLALSRNLLELMGGSIEVQSTFGAGTTFEIELERTEPVAVTADELDQVGVLESKTYSKDRRLLYIEDTVANVRLIEAILKRRPSVKLLPAMLGQLGIDLAREHKPDMLLLDLHLPDIGGEEVLATFKADPKLRDIPVVILSADATKVHYDELMELGAVAYLTKPIGVEDLLNVVDRYAGDDR